MAETYYEIDAHGPALVDERRIVDTWGTVIIGLPNGDLHQFGSNDEQNPAGFVIGDNSILEVYRGATPVRAYNAWVWVQGDKRKRKPSQGRVVGI